MLVLDRTYTSVPPTLYAWSRLTRRYERRGAVAGLIGAILLLGMLVIALSLYQAQVRWRVARRRLGGGDDVRRDGACERRPWDDD